MKKELRLVWDREETYASRVHGREYDGLIKDVFTRPREDLFDEYEVMVGPDLMAWQTVTSGLGLIGVELAATEDLEGKALIDFFMRIGYQMTLLLQLAIYRIATRMGVERKLLVLLFGPDRPADRLVEKLTRLLGSRERLAGELIGEVERMMKDVSLACLHFRLHDNVVKKVPKPLQLKLKELEVSL